MRILASLPAGSENSGDNIETVKICVRYIAALGPRGSDDRKLIFEAYREAKMAKEQNSGDGEIIAAL